MVKKKVSLGKLEINFTNRSLYTLIAFFSILVLGVGVYAIGSTPNPGHSITQLQPCDSGQILETVSGSWACVAKPSGGGGGESLWTDGGSDIYRLPSRVGIGTSTPSQKLTLFTAPGAPATSGTSQLGQIRLEQGGDNSVLDMGINSGSFGAWLQATDKSDLSVGKNLLLNPNGGNVGIGGNVGVGTSSPRSALDIKKNSGSIIVESTEFYPAGITLIDPDSSQWRLASGGGDFYIDDSLGDKKLTIDSDGAVGIGTTVPGAKLDVAGTMKAESVLVNTNFLVPAEVTLRMDNDIANQWAISNYGSFFISGPGGDPKLTIATGGNVGIGVTAPVAKLEVNNNLRLTPTSSAPVTCGSGTVGTIYYSSSSSDFRGCRANYPTGGAYGWAPL